METFTIDRQAMLAFAIAGPFAIFFIIELIAFVRVRKLSFRQERKIAQLEKEIWQHKQTDADDKISAAKREANCHAEAKESAYKSHLLGKILAIIHPYSRLIISDDKKLEAYLKKLQMPKSKKRASHLEIDRSKL